jgi:hypothetical protein
MDVFIVFYKGCSANMLFIKYRLDNDKVFNQIKSKVKLKSADAAMQATLCSVRTVTAFFLALSLFSYKNSTLEGSRNTINIVVINKYFPVVTGEQ